MFNPIPAGGGPDVKEITQKLLVSGCISTYPLLQALSGAFIPTS